MWGDKEVTRPDKKGGTQMPAMSKIRGRADELRLIPGMTPTRLLRILRREFRGAEKDQLINAAQVDGYHRGITPGWGRLHPVVARWQLKGRPEQPVIKSERKVVAVDYPLITIEARNLREGDWIEDKGLIKRLGNYSTVVLVWFADRNQFFKLREPVVVRLEDHGQTE